MHLYILTKIFYAFVPNKSLYPYIQKVFIPKIFQTQIKTLLDPLFTTSTISSVLPFYTTSTNLISCLFYSLHNLICLAFPYNIHNLIFILPFSTPQHPRQKSQQHLKAQKLMWMWEQAVVQEEVTAIAWLQEVSLYPSKLNNRIWMAPQGCVTEVPRAAWCHFSMIAVRKYKHDSKIQKYEGIKEGI